MRAKADKKKGDVDTDISDNYRENTEKITISKGGNRPFRYKRKRR
jgi:hypothetical protein